MLNIFMKAHFYSVAHLTFKVLNKDKDYLRIQSFSTEFKIVLFFLILKQS